MEVISKKQVSVLEVELAQFDLLRAAFQDVVDGYVQLTGRKPGAVELVALDFERYERPAGTNRHEP